MLMAANKDTLIAFFNDSRGWWMCLWLSYGVCLVLKKIVPLIKRPTRKTDTNLHCHWTGNWEKKMLINYAVRFGEFDGANVALWINSFHCCRAPQWKTIHDWWADRLRGAFLNRFKRFRHRLRNCSMNRCIRAPFICCANQTHNFIDTNW